MRWYTLVVEQAARQTSSAFLAQYFDYVWTTTEQDVLTALNTALDMALVDTQTDARTAQALQIAFLVVVFVGTSLFITYVLRPWLIGASKGSRRVAELLSQVPPEINIERLIEEVVCAEAEQQQVSTPAGAVRH